MAVYDNSKKYKRRKKRRADCSIAATVGIATVLLVLFLIAGSYYWIVVSSLEKPSIEAVSFPTSRQKRKDNDPPKPERNDGKKMDHGDLKFLIFHKIQDAQGAGNQMHGLLSAHLLADEFGRIVCVSDHYYQFHLAFESIVPTAIDHCPDILTRHSQEPPDTKRDQTFELLNYRHGPANECALKTMLSSSKRVLHLTANTYPRWPRVPKTFNFFTFYKAKPVLLDVLPYPHSEPPPIVVHLRKADKEGIDVRKGTNVEDLRSLGKLLPVDASQRSPFLVTNNVEWFDFFEQEYGWFHPSWTVVMHSEFGYQWPERKSDNVENLRGERLAYHNKHESIRKQLGVDTFEILQLWADFYTLLQAEKVYHTFSDFSLAAVHWMGTWSRTYDGLDKRTGKLLLMEENWIIDGETPRLVDRTPDELMECDARVRIG